MSGAVAAAEWPQGGSVRWRVEVAAKEEPSGHCEEHALPARRALLRGAVVAEVAVAVARLARVLVPQLVRVGNAAALGAQHRFFLRGGRQARQQRLAARPPARRELAVGELSDREPARWRAGRAARARCEAWRAQRFGAPRDRDPAARAGALAAVWPPRGLPGGGDRAETPPAASSASIRPSRRATAAAVAMATASGSTVHR